MKYFPLIPISLCLILAVEAGWLTTVGVFHRRETAQLIASGNICVSYFPDNIWSIFYRRRYATHWMPRPYNYTSGHGATCESADAPPGALKPYGQLKLYSELDPSVQRLIDSRK